MERKPRKGEWTGLWGWETGVMVLVGRQGEKKVRKKGFGIKK